MNNELYYKLKYHYLIDMNTIEKSIHEMIHKVNSSDIHEDYKDNHLSTDKSELAETSENNYLETIFTNLFDIIRLNTHKFTSFLPLYNDLYSFPQDTFFGCIRVDESLNVTHDLITISLINHCIIHGFYYLLQKKTCAHEPMSISSTYNISAYFGYWDTVKIHKFNEKEFRINKKNQDSNHKLQAEKKSQSNLVYYSQLFNSRKYNIEETTCYSATIIQKLCSGYTNHGFPVISGYLYNFLFPLFIELSVREFDGLLAQKEKYVNTPDEYYRLLENSYQKIYIDFSSNLYSSNVDKLLRMAPLEHFYSFSNFEYIHSLLIELMKTTAPESSHVTLKDFEGQEFIDTITYLKYMPLKYNAALFLDYALNELTYEKTTFCPNYLNKAYSLHNPLQYFPSDKNYSKSAKLSLGHSLLRDFIGILNEFTIPILEYLWEFGLDILLEEQKELDIFDIYTRYIEKNYNFLTASFTTHKLKRPNKDKKIDSLLSLYKTYRSEYKPLNNNNSEKNLFSNLDRKSAQYMLNLISNYFSNPFPKHSVDFDSLLLENNKNYTVEAYKQAYFKQLFAIFLP